MHRTNTTSRNSFSRPGSVTYAFSPSESPRRTRIILPHGSPWASGLHWHETHTEYLQVIQGSAQVHLNGVDKVYTAADGVITVPPYARHGWGRSVTDQGTELVVEEWTDPEDGQKEIFFRNLSSVILDCTANGPPNELWLNLQLFIIFLGMDNYPVFWSGPAALGFMRPTVEWVTTHVVLWIAVLIGQLLGLKSVYEEYTPSGLLSKKGQ